MNAPAEQIELFNVYPLVTPDESSSFSSEEQIFSSMKFTVPHVEGETPSFQPFQPSNLVEPSAPPPEWEETEPFVRPFTDARKLISFPG